MTASHVEDHPPAYTRHPEPLVFEENLLLRPRSGSSSVSSPQSRRSSDGNTPRSLRSPRSSTYGSITASSRGAVQDPSAPPDYTHFNEFARHLSINGCVVDIRPSAEDIPRPRYQLQQVLSSSGKPWRLHIRRLLPTESARLLKPEMHIVPSSSDRNIRSLIAKAQVDGVRYDDDTTLYQIENLRPLALLSKTTRLHIRGRRAGTLRGHLEFTGTSSRLEIRHCVKTSARDSMSEENQRKLEKWGYKAESEFEKTLVLSRRKSSSGDGSYEWVAEDPKVVGEVRPAVVAMERTKGDLTDLIFTRVVVDRWREVVVTCWVSSQWVARGLW